MLLTVFSQHLSQSYTRIWEYLVISMNATSMILQPYNNNQLFKQDDILFLAHLWMLTIVKNNPSRPWKKSFLWGFPVSSKSSFSLSTSIQGLKNYQRSSDGNVKSNDTVKKVLLENHLAARICPTLSALPSSYFDLFVCWVGNSKKWSLAEPTWIPRPSHESQSVRKWEARKVWQEESG